MLLLSALFLISCGSSHGQLQTLDIHSTKGADLVGTSSTDIWGIEPTAVFSSFDLAHWDGNSVVRHHLPEAHIKPPVVGVRAPGEAWVFSVDANRKVLAHQIDRAGTVIDHSAQFPQDVNYSSYFVASGRGGLFFGVNTPSTLQVYRLDGDRFVPFTALAYGLPIQVLGPDEAWFSDGTALFHYNAGTTTPITPAATSANFYGLISVDSAGVIYSLRSLIVENVENTMNGTLRVLRVENDIATEITLVLGPSSISGYGFTPSAVIAQGNGTFSVVGGAQAGGPYLYESTVVTRDADATSIAQSDTAIHSFGDDCADRCSSVGLVVEIFEDNSFVLQGPVNGQTGITALYVGTASELR
ncbi:MAG: hypothetical protein JWP01_4270 [Myxococcales bacterium]|nr:hypothetical protein [Myxococcales bacterium]